MAQNLPPTSNPLSQFNGDPIPTDLLLARSKHANIPTCCALYINSVHSVLTTQYPALLAEMEREIAEQVHKLAASRKRILASGRPLSVLKIVPEGYGDYVPCPLCRSRFFKSVGYVSKLVLPDLIYPGASGNIGSTGIVGPVGAEGSTGMSSAIHFGMHLGIDMAQQGSERCVSADGTELPISKKTECAGRPDIIHNPIKPQKADFIGRPASRVFPKHGPNMHSKTAEFVSKYSDTSFSPSVSKRLADADSLGTCDALNLIDDMIKEIQPDGPWDDFELNVVHYCHSFTPPNHALPIACAPSEIIYLAGVLSDAQRAEYLSISTKKHLRQQEDIETWRNFVDLVNYNQRHFR